MRYFFGSLAIVTAVLTTLKPILAVEITATALLVGGLLAMLPDGEQIK
jgi:hypothetical protein